METNANWCLLPWENKETRAEVRLLDSGKSWVYTTKYDVSPGNLAVVGYPRSKSVYVAGANCGKCGIVEACEDKLEIKLSKACNLEYVFTQNVTATQIAELVCAMKKKLGYKNNSVIHVQNGHYEAELDVYFVGRTLSRRLLAAVSVAAHPELAAEEDLALAERLIRQWPMNPAEPELEDLFSEYRAVDMCPTTACDEPELTRMRAVLLKNDLMDVSINWETIDWDKPNEWDPRSQLTVNRLGKKRAKELFNREIDEWSFFESAQFVCCMNRWSNDKSNENVLFRMLNRCVLIETVSTMMKCGMVNLLKTYLLAKPPIFECAGILRSYAGQHGIQWAEELLSAYIEEDMEAIRSFDGQSVAPVADEYLLQEQHSVHQKNG